MQEIKLLSIRKVSIYIYIYISSREFKISWNPRGPSYPKVRVVWFFSVLSKRPGGSAPNRVFSLLVLKRPPLWTGCAGRAAHVPFHNWQRDRIGRSDSCYLGRYLAFKQKTSPLDTAFSRKVASKLLTFQWIFREKACAQLRARPSTWKSKLPLKKWLFSTNSEKTPVCEQVSLSFILTILHKLLDLVRS